MKKECKKIQDKMADLIFGGLSRRDKETVTQHIESCPACQSYLQSLKSEQSLIRGFAERVEAGMEQREERMVDAIKRCNPGVPLERIGVHRSFRSVSIAKLTVAAALLIAAGYLAGRSLSSPSTDIERLQAALGPVIQQSMIERINLERELALERYAVQLKEDLARQLHDALNEYAARTLAASRAATEQRLAELIRLIEAARTVDHYQVAAALERIESDRLQDKTHLGEGLVRLAAHRNEMPGGQQASPNQRQLYDP